MQGPGILACQLHERNFEGQADGGADLSGWWHFEADLAEGSTEALDGAARRVHKGVIEVEEGSSDQV
jgi:hypothetical protein